MKKVRKVIIPVAGIGTRMLPATKAQPKEMLTLVDKPLIQYIVEECVAAGIEQVIFITSQTKRAVEDHFDRNFELEYRLKEKGKDKELAEVKAISDLASFVYTRQKAPNGDGDAIMYARDIVGDEPCAVIFPDDVIDSKVPVIGQLIDVYEKYQDPVVSVYKVPMENISRFGVIDGTKTDERTYEINDLVEKPKQEDAPSDLAIIGRYIITPEIFAALERVQNAGDFGGELRLIDAFRELRGKRSMYAYEFEGIRYDCGNKTGFAEATVAYALKDKEINKDGQFAEFVKKVAKSS